MCVVGSLNMDLVVRVERLPEVGETVTGGHFATFPGGKGANQAVAAARLGAQVSMVGRVGDDLFGDQLRAALRHEGVDVEAVVSDPREPTGVACVGVDRSGRNLILVAPGANSTLRPEHLDRQRVCSADVLLLQLEVPLNTVWEAACLARSTGVLVCLDPAPAQPLPEGLLELVDVVTPNQVEARLLIGLTVETVDQARQAAEVLRRRGVRLAVVKLGHEGAVYVSEDHVGHVPALAVRAVDTTAAGDAFSAALGVALAESRSLPEAVRFATCAAGLKVTRLGAQSMPSREEVDAVCGARKEA